MCHTENKFYLIKYNKIDCGFQYFSSRDIVAYVEMPLFGKKKSDPSEFEYEDSLMYVVFASMVTCLFYGKLATEGVVALGTVKDYL